MDFIELARSLGPTDFVRLLNEFYSELEALADKHQCMKVKAMGEIYLVCSGIPTCNPAIDAPKCAQFALDLLRLPILLSNSARVRLNVRLSMCTGPIVAGVVGKHFSYDISKTFTLM